MKDECGNWFGEDLVFNRGFFKEMQICREETKKDGGLERNMEVERPRMLK